MSSTLTTARLRLVPLTLDCTTSPDDVAAIARATDALVPDPWLLEHYDQEMLDYVRGVLEKDPASEYVPRYLVTNDDPSVIGMVGCNAPDSAGRVIIGYSVLPRYQRRGFASEALLGIIGWLRRHEGVRIIAGDTYPRLTASIRTMEHCGLVFAGPGDGEGVIRYELPV
jgi:RimJ/RimL family protein N-acetyltransferase